MPVKQYGIPLHVYATQTPKLEGTVITVHGGNLAAQVKAVTIKKNLTLLSMETVGMWHSVGFLADARGLTENEAQNLVIQGFLAVFTKELPIEYAIEFNRLVKLEMEGSLG
jgi:aspartokinase